MTRKQIIEACKLYLTKLPSPKQTVYDGVKEEFDTPLSHIAWMCEKLLSDEFSEKIEKSMRWIGFIQGVLWSHKIFSIEEMKNHNR